MGAKFVSYSWQLTYETTRRGVVVQGSKSVTFHAILCHGAWKLHQDMDLWSAIFLIRRCTGVTSELLGY
jgi:hypothetical protein